jgi:hypothetical protein
MRDSARMLLFSQQTIPTFILLWGNNNKNSIQWNHPIGSNKSDPSSSSLSFVIGLCGEKNPDSNFENDTRSAKDDTIEHQDTVYTNNTTTSMIAIYITVIR